jgi:hypothetical protein
MTDSIHSRARRLATTALQTARREPLAHFLAMGLALFVADRLTSPDAVDARAITVGPAQYGELVDIFAEARGRAPTAEEMAPLADRYVMNETLYREALALGLDEGDEMIRERIMQKMRVLIVNGVAVGEPDDATLRAWFEDNRDRYAAPEVISFSMARIDGAQGEAAAWAERLTEIEAQASAPSIDAPRVYEYLDRPRPALETVFGPAFIAALDDLPSGRWTAVETPSGWQAVILHGREPGFEADFETAALAAAADWRQWEQQRAAREALDALIAGYRVEREGYDPERYVARAEAAAARDSLSGDTSRGR